MNKLFKYFINISMSIFLISTVVAASANKKIIVKGNIPAGAIITKNKVILKNNYVFERISPSHVVSRMNNGGGITGDFDCTCNGNDGGCSAVTTPNSVTCVSSGCKSSCYMIVTIPGTGTDKLAR